MRHVTREEFSPVKTAIEVHIAEDNVKWAHFEELRGEVKLLGKKIIYSSGAISVLMILWANGVLNLRPLFKDAKADSIITEATR